MLSTWQDRTPELRVGRAKENDNKIFLVGLVIQVFYSAVVQERTNQLCLHAFIIYLYHYMTIHHYNYHLYRYQYTLSTHHQHILSTYLQYTNQRILTTLSYVPHRKAIYYQDHRLITNILVKLTRS